MLFDAELAQRAVDAIEVARREAARLTDALEHDAPCAFAGGRASEGRVEREQPREPATLGLAERDVP